MGGIEPASRRDQTWWSPDRARPKRDGGAGQTGVGLEMAGGLRVAGGRLRIHAAQRHAAIDDGARHAVRPKVSVLQVIAARAGTRGCVPSVAAAPAALVEDDLPPCSPRCPVGTST